MILVLDNRDSFTFNLVQELQALGAEVRVERAADTTADGIIGGRGASEWTGVLVGPGPGTPARAGCSEALIRALAGRAADRTVEPGPPAESVSIAPTPLPLLGVCLGHQALATALGGRVGRAAELVHGSTRAVEHDGSGVFAGIASPLDMARYNSLAVDEATLPTELRVTARTRNGEIAGLAHRRLPMFGVQGHPESILTVDRGGRSLLANFLRMCRVPVP